MLYHHIPFLTWAAVLGVLAVVIAVSFLGRLVRRHLARLTVCLVIGAAAAFGVTAWADGQRHAALAAAAHAGHSRAVSVTGELAAAFTVITVVVAVIAFIVSVLAARRLGRPYAQYSAARRGW